MNIFELLRNPIIRIIGVIFIIYFALFHRKDSPESLANRYSPEQIKKDINEVKTQGRFIIHNFQQVKEISKEKEAQKAVSANPSPFVIEDLDEGQGEIVTTCGNEVEISYGIYAQNGHQIDFITSEKIIIGSKQNSIIEENILGMKQGAIRSITIPYGFKAQDQKLAEYLKFNASDITYQVTILAILTTPNTNISCN